MFYQQALLPYLWSLAIWMTLTFAGYLLVLRKIIPRAETFWPALAIPGAFANLMNGQNGLLAFSVLGAALLWVESNPLLGGALFGLLTYKPPMGVLVPFVLIASGRWRAFFAAAFTATAIAGISLEMFGAKTWLAFFGTLDLPGGRLSRKGGVRFSTMQSVFAACAIAGRRDRNRVRSANRGCRHCRRDRNLDLAAKHSVRTQGLSFRGWDGTGLAVHSLLRPRNPRSSYCMAGP